MPVRNTDIADAFNEVADLLEIQGANPFRVRAYRNAARTVANWPASLETALREDDELPRLPGLGADLRKKVEELIRTRKLKMLKELNKEVPSGMRKLLAIQGLGPKRVRVLQEELDITSLSSLEKAAKRGRVRSLPGFGSKVEERILKALERKKTGAAEEQRIKLWEAEQIALPLLEYLRSAPGVKRAEIAGSFRRRQETVGDLDILVVATRSSPVMQRFVDYEDVEQVVSHGDTRSTVLLKKNVQVDVRVVAEKSFGSALYYFTGSKAHNIATRGIAQKKKLKINEYGVFRGTKRVAGRTEEEVFASIGLPYIEPELRENRGEIEAAGEGKLPSLITVADIRGDLHAHTHATDGRLSLEEMAAAAIRLGHEYLAITDHSKRLTVARGLTVARLREQIKKIDRLNEKLEGKIRLLKGIEVDILEDGSLDLPDSILKELDVTVCSVHSKFDMPGEKQTERIIRAMDNPNFKIFGHPSGRLIGQRPPYNVDLEKVVKAAKERGCFLEVNSQPERMDLRDVYCRMAREQGVLLVISSDAHSDNDLKYLRFGVGQARRGWVSPGDVLNTRPWSQVKKLLKRKSG